MESTYIHISHNMVWVLLVAFQRSKVCQHVSQSLRISSSNISTTSIGNGSPLGSRRWNGKSNSLTDVTGLGLGLINGAPRVDNHCWFELSCTCSFFPFLGSLGCSAETDLRGFLAGLLFTSPLVKSSRRKRGSDVISTESLLRSGAAPSRKAWAVFSWARLVSTSFHAPLAWSFSRNLPGGVSRVWMCSTMLLVIATFFVLVLVLYSLCLVKLWRETRCVRCDCNRGRQRGIERIKQGIYLTHKTATSPHIG